MKNALIRMLTISLFLLAGCSDSGQIPEATSSVQTGERGESLEAIAHDAFIYAYPMMEQVKTVNGMFDFMGTRPNKGELKSNLVFQKFHQAATWSTCVSSIPSLNLIPVTSLAR